MNRGRGSAVCAPRWTALAAALALAGAPRPAAALWHDQLQLFAAQAVRHDSNLFRFGDGVDPVPILGDSAISDRYRASSVGLVLDLGLGAQRVVGDVTLSRQRFDRFTSLDHSEHSGEFAWDWRVGRRFDGRVAFGDESRRGSFSNLQGGIQSKRLNFIETREKLVEARFRVATRWELGGSVAERRHANSAPAFNISDARIDGSGLTLSYLPGSGNRAGFRWQKQTGRLPVRQLVGGMLVDNSYEQHRASLLVDWTLSEQSRVDLSLGRASRSYPQSAARNYSDWEFSAGYEWRPRAGFSLTAVAQNGVSDTEEINIGLVVVKRLALTPTLRLGDGVTLSAYVELSDRKYLGDPGLEAIDGSAVTERFHVVGLTVAWTPIPRLRLGFAWRKQRRDSTLSFANYDADVVEFEARVSL